MRSLIAVLLVAAAVPFATPDAEACHPQQWPPQETPLAAGFGYAYEHHHGCGGPYLPTSGHCVYVFQEGRIIASACTLP